MTDIGLASRHPHMGGRTRVRSVLCLCTEERRASGSGSFGASGRAGKKICDALLGFEG